MKLFSVNSTLPDFSMGQVKLRKTFEQLNANPQIWFYIDHEVWKKYADLVGVVFFQEVFFHWARIFKILQADTAIRLPTVLAMRFLEMGAKVFSGKVLLTSGTLDPFFDIEIELVVGIAAVIGRLCHIFRQADHTCEYFPHGQRCIRNGSSAFLDRQSRLVRFHHRKCLWSLFHHMSHPGQLPLTQRVYGKVLSRLRLILPPGVR